MPTIADCIAATAIIGALTAVMLIGAATRKITRWRQAHRRNNRTR